jgi:hypothetical protein
MAAMKLSLPIHGPEAEWNAAYIRLEDYLRALKIVNKIQQSQIILQWLQAAATRHIEEPGKSPTALALEEAHSAQEKWFERIYPRSERILVLGHVALYITDAMEKWPIAFLADEIPPDFKHEMLESEVRAGPDLQVSSMVPRPIDISPIVEGIFREDVEKIEKGAVLAALLAVTTVSAAILLFFSN